jgi:hypothetical protein
MPKFRYLRISIIFAFFVVVLLFCSCKTCNCPAYSNLSPGTSAEKHV